MFDWHDVGVVLVPVDLDEPTSDALKTAMTARPRTLHVVYVLPELEPSLLTQIDAVHRKEVALDALQRWTSAQGAPEDTRTHVRIGVPSGVVPEIATEIGADLVVMSSHGRRGLSRAMMGSVAERIVRFSPCPVFVLKAGAN